MLKETVVFAFRLLELVISFAVLLIMYWSPTSVAYGRRARHWVDIALLNTLGGWTVIGWIVAMIWSLVAKPERESRSEPGQLIVRSTSERRAQPIDREGQILAGNNRRAAWSRIF